MSTLLPHLVTGSAQRFPERPAVVMDGRTLTYGELESQSNQFARSLAGHGVRPGDRVALWLPRSIEGVVALYGVMKAGAAYVPVDPGAPPMRLAYIARDCAVSGLVTVAERAAPLAEAFATGAPMRAVWLADPVAPDARARAETPGAKPAAEAAGAPGATPKHPADAPRVAGLPSVTWAEMASESAAPVPVHALEGDLAYILYTSGSTGEPKGVMLSHRNALAFVEWAGDVFQVTHQDRLANHAPLHFDLSTFDLFAGARAGAAIYPLSPRIASFPAAVARQWVSDRLTVWYATPSTLVLMLTRGGLGNLDLGALRVLLFAGEVFPVKYLRELMRLAPRARFANLYGPTETNVCTWHELNSPPEGDQPLPIGLSCPYDDALVLDENLKRVASGSVGELWVRGATVMRGYWGRPERTALALQPIEIAPGITDLAYRTGDLVRARPDGNLEFLGRRDHQVKTRGYRVELGEIETVLHRHPAVDEAVVLAIPDEEVTHRLRAVVVLRSGSALDEAALRQHCAESLPRYMVPENVEFRRELPRTSSGKVDRQALARPRDSQRT
jgi:amino acid adenylation domain-containing protein